MPYIKICKNCGKEFTTTCKKSVNCSRKCKGEYSFKKLISDVELENNISNLKEWLIEKYSNEMQTFRWLVNKLKINNRTVNKLLNYYNIPIRYGSEAIKAQWASEEKRNARREPNQYIICENYCKIKIKKRFKNEYEYILIDIEDIEKCKKYHWGLDSQNYVAAYYMENGKENRIKLHRHIINVLNDKIVDHKNGNPLDNRKSNLRICTKLENSWNRKPTRNNKTKVKGVSLRKSGRYQAQITYKGKEIYLGTYINKLDAIEARKQAELKYFGEYSYYNRENA